MAQALGDVISQLKRSHGIQLEWLDVGCGLAGISPRIDENPIGPHPLPDLNDYLAAIIEPLKAVLQADDITLYFEPGRTLLKP